MGVLMEYIGSILYDDALLKEKQEIIIFGAGMYGKKILHYLERNGVKENVAAFCDSSEKMQGTSVENVPVYDVEEAWKRYPEAIFLVSGGYMDEMYRILRSKGIGGVHMLFF